MADMDTDGAGAGYSAADQDAIIRTVAGEAQGESPLGQQAVTSVILNRAKQSGQTPTKVVSSPGQFDAWSLPATQNLKPTDAVYKTIASNIQPILSGGGTDPTNGATYYYNPTLQAQQGGKTPGWANGPSTSIGNHVFYGGSGGAAGASESISGDDFDKAASTQTGQQPLSDTGADGLSGADFDKHAGTTPAGWQSGQQPDNPTTELQKAYNDKYEGSINSPLLGPLSQFTNSLDFGLGPVIAGASQGAFAKLGLLGPDAQKIPFGDIYDASRNGYAHALSDYQQQHPVFAGISNLAGAASGAEGTVAGKIGQLGGVGTRILGAGVASGLRGLGDTASSGSEDVGDYVKNGALNAGLGAATGGAMEGINGLSGIATSALSNPLAKWTAGQVVRVGGGAALGAAGAAATGQDWKTGGEIGALGGELAAIGHANKTTTTPDQNDIVMQRLAKTLGNGDYSQAADNLRNSSSPTLFGALGDNAQDYVSRMSPTDYNGLKGDISDAKQSAMQNLNDNGTQIKQNLKDAIAQHTGISEDDTKEVFPNKQGMNIASSDPYSTIHNLYNDVNSNNFSPRSFYTTPTGQAFDTFFPDENGTLNGAVQKYVGDSFDHASNLEDFNGHYNTSGLIPPKAQDFFGDETKKGMLFGAFTEPTNPIAGAFKGALAGADIHNAPQIKQGTSAGQSQIFRNLATQNPSDVADQLETAGQKQQQAQQQTAAKSAATKARAPGTAAALATTTASALGPVINHPAWVVGADGHPQVVPMSQVHAFYQKYGEYDPRKSQTGQ